MRHEQGIPWNILDKWLWAPELGQVDKLRGSKIKTKWGSNAVTGIKEEPALYF